MSTLVFWSAVDYAGEFQALLEARQPLGIAVKRMSQRVFDSFVRHVRATNRTTGTPIFVDSGAYSEKSEAGFTERDWDLVLTRYQQLADAGKSRIFLVAPDAIADFAGTENRLRAAAPRLQAMLTAGAHLLLPLQPGPGSLAQREHRLRVAARLDGTRYDALVHPAFPWTKKVPVKPSMAELGEYVRERRPTRVHFLGVGEQNVDWAMLVATVQRASPQTIVQGDSNRFGAMLGQGRKLTRAGELVDTGVLDVHPFDEEDAGLTDEGGENLGLADENIVDIADWTTVAERTVIARDALLDSESADLFIHHPARFLEEVDSQDWAYLHEAVDGAWARRAARFAPDRRRHLAVRRILRDPPPAESLLSTVEAASGRGREDPDVTQWLRDAGVRLVRGQLGLLSGAVGSESARRRLADALEEDEGSRHSRLHALRTGARRETRKAPTLLDLYGSSPIEAPVVKRKLTLLDLFQ